MLLTYPQAVHQAYILEHISPMLLHLQGLKAVPSNLQALYRRADMSVTRTKALLQQLAEASRGIPFKILLDIQQSMRHFYDVSLYAAKIEVDDIEEAVCSACDDVMLRRIQENHYVALMGENARKLVVGLLFYAIPMRKWSSIGALMGLAYPGWMLVIWSLHKYSRAFEAPLQKIIKRPQDCRSVAISL